MRQELDWQLGLIVKKYNRKLCFNSFFSRTYRMGNNFPDSWFSVRYSLQNLSPTPMIVSCFIGNFYLMTFLPSNVFSVSSNLSNLVYFHIERGKARHCVVIEIWFYECWCCRLPSLRFAHWSLHSPEWQFPPASPQPLLRRFPCLETGENGVADRGI